jgi:hypothetical protein
VVGCNSYEKDGTECCKFGIKSFKTSRLDSLKFTEIQSKSRIAKLSKILNIDTNVVFFDPVKKI